MGLASAMKTAHKLALALLEQDPNQVFNLSVYIRQLRTHLRDLLMENTIYCQEATLPDIGDINPSFKYSPLNEDYWWFQYCNEGDERFDYLFITLTFDPRKFPQLICTSKEEQKKYIERVMTIAVDQSIITSFYGVYELQGNGNIHYHFIASNYDNPHSRKTISEFFSAYLTDRKENKYAVDVKRVTNMKGLIGDYFKKSPEGHLHNLQMSGEKSLEISL